DVHRDALRPAGDPHDRGGDPRALRARAGPRLRARGAPDADDRPQARAAGRPAAERVCRAARAGCRLTRGYSAHTMAGLPHLGLYRRLTAVALVLGPALFLLDNLLHPKEYGRGHEAEQLHRIGTSYQRWQVAHGIGLLS